MVSNNNIGSDGGAGISFCGNNSNEVIPFVDTREIKVKLGDEIKSICVPACLKTLSEVQQYCYDNFRDGRTKNIFIQTVEGRKFAITIPAHCEGDIEKIRNFCRSVYKKYYYYLSISQSPRGKKGDKK